LVAVPGAGGITAFKQSLEPFSRAAGGKLPVIKLPLCMVGHVGISGAGVHLPAIG